MDQWDTRTINCYKRQVIAITYNSDACKTMINGQRCQFSTANCFVFETIKELYKKFGPPAGCLDIKDTLFELKSTNIIKFSTLEDLFLRKLSEVNRPLNREAITNLTGLKPSCIPSTVSRINQKKPGLIKITKSKQKTYYQVTSEV